MDARSIPGKVYAQRVGDNPPGMEERRQKGRGEKREEGKLLCYPNPFTKTTVISVQCPVPSDKTAIELSIYDLSGKLVKDFSLSINFSALTTAVSWDGKDNNGEEVKNGVYFIKLNSKGNKFEETEKIIKLK